MQYENSQLTGSTLYFVQLDAATGNGWNGSAYVTYTSTRSTFARPLTEISGTGLWQGTVGGTARYLRFLIFLQSGGSPSFADDVKVAEARYYWDGTTLMPQGPVVQVTGSVNGDIGGKVLGGGSGTITGVGVRADNRDGEAITTPGDFSQIAADVADAKVAAETVQGYLPATGPLVGAGSLPANFSTMQINSSGHVERVTLVDTTTTNTDMRGTDNAFLATNYSAPPTAQQIRDAMKLAPSGGAAATNSIDDKIDNVESGSGTTIPVIQTPVPSSRTWVLKPTSDGLRGERPLTRSVGEAQPFAVSFRHDLGTNGQLVSLDSITFTGPVGGIVIDTLDRGVDDDKAKFKIQALLVGTYVITVEVSYSSGDGGGTAIGEVTLIVK